MSLQRVGVPLGNMFAVGTNKITYVAADESGNQRITQQDVIVIDAPPVIGGTATPATLFPPDRKMVEVTLEYQITDNCGVAAVFPLTVTSSDPETGTGDNTSPDWEIVDDHRVRLRAETGAGNDPRFYFITIATTDIHGNMGTQTLTVTANKKP